MTLVPLGACIRKDMVERKSQQAPRQCDVVASQMVDNVKCHTAHPIFPTTVPLTLGQLEEGGSKWHFQGDI